MEWIYVVIAGLLEVLSINYMNKWQLVKHLGLKKSGIGSVGGVLVGIIRYGESANWKRLVCIAMILSSVVGLKLVS